MKILLTADENKSLMNGAAGVVITLEDALRKMGHEVKVLMLSPDNHGIKEGENDYYLPSYPVKLYPDLRMTSVRRHPYITEIKEWKPDIIHIHTEGSMARIGRDISRCTGAPYIMTMHTYYEKFVFHKLAGAKFISLLFSGFSTFCYRGSTVMTVPSAKGKMLLRSYKIKKPVVVIPNGIKLYRFQKEFSEEEREALLRELGISDDARVFVVISRISAEKKLDELLEYFADVVKADGRAVLILAGDGPELEDLKKQVRDAGIADHVKFTGMIAQEDLYRYYKSGIAFLSASDFEMHSLTYLEAIACGLPLVCKDHPCLVGVLKNNENGFAWKTREEFVSGCLKLIRDKELCRQFSDASLKRADRFDEMVCARRMAKLYEKVCSHKEEIKTEK